MKNLPIVLAIGLFSLACSDCYAQAAPEKSSSDAAATLETTAAGNRTDALAIEAPASGLPSQGVAPQDRDANSGGGGVSHPKGRPFKAPLKIFSLKFIPAEDALRIVNQVYDAAGVTVAADARTNALIVRAAEPLIVEIEALLMGLDQASSKDSAGTKSIKRGKPEPVGGRNAEGPYPATFSFYLGIARNTENTATLRKQFDAAEKQTRELAARHREMLTNVDRPEADRTKAREELQEAVKKAFQLRQNLHRAELAEFAERLDRIRESIGARDRIAQQIVDRRVEELLDPNVSWETDEVAGATATASEPSISLPGSSAMPKPAPAPSRSQGNRGTWVRLSGSQKDIGTVQWIDGPGNFVFMSGRGRVEIPSGASVKLRATQNRGVYGPTNNGFSEAKGYQRLAAFLAIQCAEANPTTATFLAHNEIPLQITDEDWEQIASNNVVTKVIYLPHDLTATDEDLVATVVSSRLDPAVDPVKEAERRGTVIAVIRIGLHAKDVFGDRGADGDSARPKLDEGDPAANNAPPKSPQFPFGGIY